MSEKITPIIGHEKAQAQLARLMTQGILPHAILLTGPKGIGKAALADTLSRCLLTGEGAQEADAGLFGDSLPSTPASHLSYDPHHPANARINSGGHGNLKWTVPLEDDRKMSAHTIYIEQTRSIVEFMHKTTSEKGWRIVIIDPADGMNANAENGLLKVLEEPPKDTLLILVTSQPDKLLPTTRSRCREIKLYPPTINQVVDILQTQNISITADEQLWLSQLAPISVGQWARYVELEADKTYTQWLELLDSQNIAAIQSFVGKAAKLDAPAWQLTGDLLLCALHRLCLSQQQPLDLLAVEQKTFPALLAKANSEHWQSIWQQAVFWLPQTTSGNYDKKQVLQSLLFEAGNAPKKAA